MGQCIGYGMKMGGCKNQALENEMFCESCKKDMETELNAVMLKEPSSRPPEEVDPNGNPVPLPIATAQGLDFQVLDFIDKKFEELKAFIDERLPKKKPRKKSQSPSD